MVEIRGRYTNAEDGMKSGVTFYGSNGYMNARLADDRVAVDLGVAEARAAAPQTR